MNCNLVKLYSVRINVPSKIDRNQGFFNDYLLLF